MSTTPESSSARPTVDSTRRFSDRVDNYVRYRPGYPEEIISLLRAECGLTANSLIADVGSGTGKLAELFLTHGHQVIGVEPNPEMRAAGEGLLGKYPRFSSVTGTAEATTLPHHVVDLVTVGQAFHWFDLGRTRLEFQRILKPSGWVALIANERRLDRTPFLVAYEKLLLEFAADYQETKARRLNVVDLRPFFGAEPQRKTFPYSQSFDFTELKGRLLSTSTVPNVGQPGNEAMVAALKQVFAAHATEGRVAFEYDTLVCFGPLR